MPSNSRQAARAAQPFAGGALVERQAKQSASDAYEFVMATADVDRMGDVVEIGGVDLAAFRENPIALWQHNPSQPIGTWENVRKVGNKLVGRLALAAEGTSELIDGLRQLIEQRILSAVSVGFRVLKCEPISDDSEGYRFVKSELVECSLVSIPANPAALRIRALDVLGNSPAAQTILGQRPAIGSTSRTGGTRPLTRRQLAFPQGIRTMETVPKGASLPERITFHQTRIASIDAEIRAIDEAAAEGDGREYSDDEVAAIETLTGDKAANERQLAAAQTMENAIAARAQPAGNGGGSFGQVRRMEARPRAQEKPGFMLAKLALISAVAHVTKQPAERVIATRYGADERVAACFDYVRRTATNVADTTTPTWAAELVQHDIAAFMADLENVSVFAAIRARGRAVSLDGVGSITIPSRTNRGNLAGAWVGETGVIPVLQGSFGEQKLEPTKLAGITTFSKELVNASNNTVEQILRDALRMDTADLLDRNLLDNRAAQVGIRPAGLQVGANSAASGGPASVEADLKAAIAPILAAGSTGTAIVLIANPAQVLGLQFAVNMLGLPAYPTVSANGTLAGYGIIASNNVPAGVVFVVDASEFASAAGIPGFEVSEEATLTMANANTVAPTQAVSASGVILNNNEVGPNLGLNVGGPELTGPGAVGLHTVSMFQTWSVALRMIFPVHWKMLRDDMVSVITGVDWGGDAP